MFWDEDDQGLFTGSSDGQVNYWRIDDALAGNKTQILSRQNLNVSCVISKLIGQDRFIYISGTINPENE